MPSFTRAPKTPAVVLAIAAALGLVAGCGGSSSSPASTASEVITQTITVLGPRDFGYVNNGLQATLRVEGSTGTVVFTNGRTTSVAKPAVYLVDLKGARVNAALPGARALAPGAGQTLSVRFPPTADIATATFFGLELGGADAGGFTDR